MVTNQVETGVRTTLANLGIKEPTTAVEKLAIWLAQQLDYGVEEKNAAAISRELRLTLKDIEEQTIPDKENDETSKLLSKER